MLSKSFGRLHRRRMRHFGDISGIISEMIKDVEKDKIYQKVSYEEKSLKKLF